MAHPGGRPRTVSLTPDEMIALGEEMVEWVKQNQPLHLKQWYSIEKMFTYNEWKTMIVIPEFFPYYEQAINLVSLQYLDKDGPIKDSIAHRWQRVYFKDLKSQEDEDAQAETERKKSILHATPPFDDLIDKQNEEMSENARLRKRIAELEANAV